MKKQALFLSAFFILVTSIAIAQPYADILNFNYQTFSSNYQDSTQWKNKTDDYFLNFFLPKNLKNGNTRK